MNISHADPVTSSLAIITARNGLTVQVSWGNVFRVCNSVIEAVRFLTVNDCPDWRYR